MAFVTRCWTLLPFLTEPTLLLALKTDVPLAKAGPIRNGGNASMLTYLRRKKTNKRLCSCNCDQRRAK